MGKMKFEKITNVYGTTSHMCNDPFSVVKSNGDYIYLNGHYTPKQLEEIIRVAQEIAKEGEVPEQS